MYSVLYPVYRDFKVQLFVIEFLYESTNNNLKFCRLLRVFSLHKSKCEEHLNVKGVFPM